MPPSFIYLDRYRNQGTRTYSEHAAYTEAADRYRPDAGLASFEVAVFEMPREGMLCFTAGSPGYLSAKYLVGDQVLFCLHPQVLETAKDDIYLKRTLAVGTRVGGIAVSPSSSTRTLYVADDVSPHALKVHFPFRISRYGRKMREEVLEQAINISRELEAGRGVLESDFGFLREVIAISHKNLQPHLKRGENWGYLVRDMTPFPRVVGQRTLFPGFALYGDDFFEPGSPPLLFALMGDKEPQTFILEKIMFPIIRHWIGCFQNFGYLLEPHGQNALLEIDDENEIRRIIHRDLSWGIDMRRRRDIGLSDENLNHYNRMEGTEFLSITYDKFMGGHFFDRIVASCRQKFPALKRSEFTGACRAEFQRLLPEHERYFPRTVHYFSDEKDQFDKPLFLDTGQRPEWRP